MSGRRCGPGGALAAALLVATLAALSGCATTRLDTEWTDAARAGPGFRTWFVLAAMPDPVKRRLWEDAFTRELAARGVSATPSHRLFPEEFPDTAIARQKLREGGFDGLLVVRKGAEDERERGRRGGAALGVGGTFVPFWGVYVSVSHVLARGGAPVVERVVRWDVEVYEAAGDGRLAWAGRSPLVDPAASERVSREVAASVVPRLRRARLVR